MSGNARLGKAERERLNREVQHWQASYEKEKKLRAESEAALKKARLMLGQESQQRVDSQVALQNSRIMVEQANRLRADCQTELRKLHRVYDAECQRRDRCEAKLQKLQGVYGREKQQRIQGNEQSSQEYDDNSRRLIHRAEEAIRGLELRNQQQRDEIQHLAQELQFQKGLLERSNQMVHHGDMEEPHTVLPGGSGHRSSADFPAGPSGDVSNLQSSRDSPPHSVREEPPNQQVRLNIDNMSRSKITSCTTLAVEKHII
ncbi:hypothetical protein OCU04_003326 [Sclerotinia nivalis]|uniref:Uncharacterized protein n=1 Tax=Sclerotinia nivalis TaxID=352851 RepID=A0A9X0ARQ9_9HELO|nr:hypothetical protein OCU04_003326 [Sclerotinia nivalis]